MCTSYGTCTCASNPQLFKILREPKLAVMLSRYWNVFHLKHPFSRNHHSQGRERAGACPSSCQSVFSAQTWGNVCKRTITLTNLCLFLVFIQKQTFMVKHHQTSILCVVSNWNKWTLPNPLLWCYWDYSLSSLVVVLRYIPCMDILGCLFLATMPKVRLISAKFII